MSDTTRDNLDTFWELVDEILNAVLFVLIGLLGGFTTFSTLGYETFAMLRDGDVFAASANLSAHIVGGLLCVWLGHSAASAL